jgi:hypothetical protein
MNEWMIDWLIVLNTTYINSGFSSSESSSRSNQLTQSSTFDETDSVTSASYDSKFSRQSSFDGYNHPMSSRSSLGTISLPGLSRSTSQDENFADWVLRTTRFFWWWSTFYTFWLFIKCVFCKRNFFTFLIGKDQVTSRISYLILLLAKNLQILVDHHQKNLVVLRTREIPLINYQKEINT